MKFETFVLAALIGKGGEAYGTAILEKAEEMTGREISVGALFTTLERMQAKGWLTSWYSDPKAERNGRRRRYFRVSAEGAAVYKQFSSQIPAFGNFLVPEIAQ